MSSPDLRGHRLQSRAAAGSAYVLTLGRRARAADNWTSPSSTLQSGGQNTVLDASGTALRAHAHLDEHLLRCEPFRASEAPGSKADAAPGMGRHVFRT